MLSRENANSWCGWQVRAPAKRTVQEAREAAIAAEEVQSLAASLASKVQPQGESGQPLQRQPSRVSAALSGQAGCSTLLFSCCAASILMPRVLSLSTPMIMALAAGHTHAVIVRDAS